MIGITGATGFVGMVHTVALVRMGIPVRMLVREGHPFATQPPTGVEVCVGSLEDPASLERFAEGLEVCFHYAARAAFKGEYEKFHAANIQGTRNLIHACRNVPRLIATSTQAVALEDKDIVEQSEDHPYPQHFVDFYGQSKAEVEQMVIHEHAGGTMIRPPWTWGAGDTNNLPTLIKPHMKNQMLFFGGGQNLLEAVQVANFVHASMLVAQNDKCRHRIYFVSDDEPVTSKNLINDQLVACGFKPCTRNLPKLMVRVFLLSEKLTNLVGSKATLLYTFRTQTFSDDRIRAATGYTSIVSREDGLQELSDWVQFVGGPEAILSGRRRGEAQKLVQDTWDFLMQRSLSVQALINFHTPNAIKDHS
jgi:2-alkyl-3-oxoalkanoate reductase